MKKIKTLLLSFVAIVTFVFSAIPVSASSVHEKFDALKSSIHDEIIDRHDTNELGKDNNQTKSISINDPSVKTVVITMNANVDDILAGQPTPNRPVKGQTRYLLAFDNHEDAVNAINQLKTAYSNQHLIDIDQLHGIKTVTQLNQIVSGHKTIVISQQEMSMDNLVMTLNNMTTLQLSL